MLQPGSAYYQKFSSLLESPVNLLALDWKPQTSAKLSVDHQFALIILCSWDALKAVLFCFIIRGIYVGQLPFEHMRNFAGVIASPMHTKVVETKLAF